MSQEIVVFSLGKVDHDNEKKEVFPCFLPRVPTLELKIDRLLTINHFQSEIAGVKREKGW